MLGLRIKNLRKENDWNQLDLAKKIGVGRTTICEYERETIMPPYEKLQAMANVFGVSVKYLTGESNSKNEDVVDVYDVFDQLTKAIDLLEQQDLVVRFNNQKMNNESKKVAAEQLKQTIRILEYLNKGEQ